MMTDEELIRQLRKVGTTNSHDNSVVVRAADRLEALTQPSGKVSDEPETANAIITHSLDEQLRGIDDAIRAGYEARNVIVGSALYPVPVGVTPTHRHKKRGTEYVLIGIGKMQAEGWFAKVPGPGVFASDHTVDMREVAIYRSVDDGSLWVRPREEFEDGRFEALASHEPAPTDTQEGVNEAGEVVAWAAFDLEADFMAAFANERAVSGYVERVGEGAIHPLVRQSALTACQQEVERLRDELIKSRNYWSEQCSDLNQRNAELVKALDEIASDDERGDYEGVVQFARAALGGQSNE